MSVSFDQPVSLAGADGLVVRDESGRAIACRPAAAIDPNDITRVVCDLSRAATAGRYTVSWRVVSADTHVVHGAFTFGVGTAASAPEIERASPYDPSAPLASILRFLELYGTLVACGALAFEAAATRGASALLRRASRRCRNLAAASALVALVASFPALVVQALAANGGSLGDLPQSVFATATGSQWGYAWIVRAIALATLVFARTRSGRFVDRTLALAALGALVSFSLSGHALDRAPGRVAVANVVADVVHAGGAAIWVGGIAAFVAVLPFVTMRSAIGAYSPLAVASVLAIVLSGTYASVVHVGSLHALTTTAYGSIVVAKIGLLVPLLALGARNFLRGKALVPIEGAARDLRIEAVLALAIVALSAVLTGLPPARDAARTTAIASQ